jgi:hypothetical protein
MSDPHSAKGVCPPCGFLEFTYTIFVFRFGFPLIGPLELMERLERIMG